MKRYTCPRRLGDDYLLCDIEHACTEPCLGFIAWPGYGDLLLLFHRVEPLWQFYIRCTSQMVACTHCNQYGVSHRDVLLCLGCGAKPVSHINFRCALLPPARQGSVYFHCMAQS